MTKYTTRDVAPVLGLAPHRVRDFAPEVPPEADGEARRAARYLTGYGRRREHS